MNIQQLENELWDAADQLPPEQNNRAALVLEGKFYRDKAGNKLGMGLKVFP